MMGLYLATLSLLAFPFLFPRACATWLRQVRTWLENRQEKQEKEAKTLKALIDLTQEWAAWVKDLRQQLPGGKSQEKHYLLFAQALAAGQRYLQSLQSINSQEASGTYRKKASSACRATARICQQLEKILELSRAKQKIRG